MDEKHADILPKTIKKGIVLFTSNMQFLYTTLLSLELLLLEFALGSAKVVLW